MRRLVTRPGEMIDQACRRAYGTETGTVEAVLAANPGLAALPYRLPGGTVIRLPELAAPSRSDPVVKLWD